MSNIKKNNELEEQDLFEDSLFLANFQESSFENAFPSTSNNNSFKGPNLNVSALCCDEEISGYDKITGRTWIYPTNYPVRDYQFNIIKASLVQNTLVSLPTGLGKTFIAAVIMYNFYRWYPVGKIIFTAPTRPLVAQQIDACYNIIGIPPEDTIEMTGTMQVNTRKIHWQSKRVFFATPQVISNDLKAGICPSDKIRCLVFDEAHRARGNYAYCQIISILSDAGHRTFRVLALSATPGSKVEDVISVVNNLHIAHLELRTENCIDVAPYSHTRKISTVIIQLGQDLTRLREYYVEILDDYARRLKQLNILPNNVGNLSKGRIVMLYKEYQTKDRSSRHPQHNWIMKDFTVLIALYHGLELLVKHGSRVFLNFFDDHPEKSWIQSDDRLTVLLERLRDDLGINPLSLDRSIQLDGTVPEMPKDLRFGHPKFDKLKEIMLEHFTRAKNNNNDTRAIVFCEYRESVNLVHCLLLQCRPLIVAQTFIGQGASGKDGKTMISQKQQLRVMRSFREGACNTLVATCVAEEGLDVGSVDLIVCFDISTKSPVRLVQRCGRTGRERSGQVYILVTEGREHQTLMDCMRQRDGLNRRVLQSKEVENNLYKHNPRMMPHGFTPTCQKMFIAVKENDIKNKKDTKSKKGQKDLRTMLLGKTSSNSNLSMANKTLESTGFIRKDEFEDIFPKGFQVKDTAKDIKEYWNLDKDTITDFAAFQEISTKFTTRLDWQRKLQKTVNVAHSYDTEMLSELLEYCESKKCETPTPVQLATQEVDAHIVAKSSPIKQDLIKRKVGSKKKQKEQKPYINKDGDIRALFSTATKSTTNFTKALKELGITNHGSLPTTFVDLLIDMNLVNTMDTRQCRLCTNIYDCAFFNNIPKVNMDQKLVVNFLKSSQLPDLELIDEIDLDSIENYTAKNKNNIVDTILNISIDNKVNTSTNFDLDFEFISPEDMESKKEFKTENTDNNFDLGGVEDIFVESSPEEAIANKVEVKTPSPKKALDFFGLDSIEDIFADSDDDVHSKKDVDEDLSPRSIKQSPSKLLNQDTEVIRTPSPSLLSEKYKTKIEQTSPILSSQNRKFQLSLKKRASNFSTPLLKPAPETPLPGHQKEADISTNKSMLTVTQLVDMINRSKGEHSKLNHTVNKSNHDYDIIDLLNDKEERSPSPILLTQSERNTERNPSPILLTQIDNRRKMSTSKSLHSRSTGKDSFIILDSDSDSSSTQDYDVNLATANDLNTTFGSPLSVKRKLDTSDENASSSFFNKTLKTDTLSQKPLTVQEKILAVLTSEKTKSNRDETINFTMCSPFFRPEKENVLPLSLEPKAKNGGVDRLNFLQQFSRDAKVPFSEKIDNNINVKSQKRKTYYSDSDDDFVDVKNIEKKRRKSTNNESFSIIVHKKRKRKKAKNVFIDSEAELSDKSCNDSGDELTDESVGSIVNFICDDDVTTHEDMQAHYLKSVKSTVNGGFKIPQLPKRYDDEDIFSQYVDEDAYEMDSFCVDSNIGLTQVNDVSELELAELQLEMKKRGRRKLKNITPILSQGDESPAPKKKPNKVRRRISSDSDE